MKEYPNDLRHLRCSIFSDEHFIIFPFCAAAGACNWRRWRKQHRQLEPEDVVSFSLI